MPTKALTLVKSPENNNFLSKPTITMPNFEQSEPPKIFVTRWVDYSAKYGLGFMLSDSTTGVHFNDSSKLVSLKDSQSFVFIVRDKNLDKKHDKPTSYQFSQTPDNLKKRVELF
jgi:hypothetical protein